MSDTVSNARKGVVTESDRRPENQVMRYHDCPSVTSSASAAGEQHVRLTDVQIAQRPWERKPPYGMKRNLT